MYSNLWHVLRSNVGFNYKHTTAGSVCKSNTPTIGGSKEKLLEMRPCPFLSISNSFAENGQNNRLASPPPSGKSWIRHYQKRGNETLHIIDVRLFCFQSCKTWEKIKNSFDLFFSFRLRRQTFWSNCSPRITRVRSWLSMTSKCFT